MTCTRTNPSGGARTVVIGVALAAVVCARHARAQDCGGRWLPGERFPGTNGAVVASTIWDPDGAGPSSPLLVIAGDFTMVCGTAANRIAAWDPATDTWTAFGSGMDKSVTALAALPSGELAASGTFTLAGGHSIYRLARWTGFDWTPVGAGLSSGSVNALAATSHGTLIAGGSFSSIGGVSAKNVAVWDGVQWSALGGGTDRFVSAVAALADGGVVVGGNFTLAGATPANHVARWDGSAWNAMGAGLSYSPGTISIRAIAETDAGVVVAGRFDSAGGVPVNHIASWDGSGWSALATGLSHSTQPARVDALLALPSGELLAGGVFDDAGGVATGGAARWDGAEWHALNDEHPGNTTTIARAPNGRIVFGGFDLHGDTRAENMVQWDGSGWLPFGRGDTGFPDAVVSRTNGDLIFAGAFDRFGGVAANNIASWNGASWSAIGDGLDGQVFAVGVLGDGGIVAGGMFQHSGSTPTPSIAHWSGDAWTALGGGVNNWVQAMTLRPNGNLVVGGRFTAAGGTPAKYIAAWDGTAWMPLSSGLDNFVTHLVTMSNGDVVAGGSFTKAAGLPVNFIARWNDHAWSAIGGGLSHAPTGLLALPNGGLLVGGAFTHIDGVPARHIARWDGGAWHALGDGPDYSPSAMVLSADGRLFVGGYVLNDQGVGEYHLSVWDGRLWSPFCAPIDGEFVMTLSSSHELVLAGSFTSIGGHPSSRIARHTFANIPWIAAHPAPTTIAAGQTLVLSATPATSYESVRVQWRRHGVDIHDGPGGASLGGGFVTGAARAMESPTTGLAALLTIHGAKHADSGAYEAVFFNDCGEAVSRGAMVVVGFCPADLNADGFVNGDDYDLFAELFESGDPAADLNRDGVVNGEDHDALALAFGEGC